MAVRVDSIVRRAAPVTAPAVMLRADPDDTAFQVFSRFPTAGHLVGPYAVLGPSVSARYTVIARGVECVHGGDRSTLRQPVNPLASLVCLGRVSGPAAFVMDDESPLHGWVVDRFKAVAAVWSTSGPRAAKQIAAVYAREVADMILSATTINQEA